MSKPLELTIFPRLERPRSGADISAYREQWRREAALQGSKHLTDAELAAEYWAAAEESTSRYFRVMASGEAQRIEGVILRFARLPHYDEVDQ